MADIELKKLGAYTVRAPPKEGQRARWVRIGTAYAHALGEGFNIYLDAMPLDGKLVLLPPRKDEPTAAED